MAWWNTSIYNEIFYIPNVEIKIELYCSNLELLGMLKT